MLKLLKGLFGSRGRSPNLPTPVAAASNVVPLHLASARGFNQEVVGEGYRQAAFEHVMGRRTARGFDDEVVAQLVFDDGNPHDPHAVGVLLDRYHVGYIPRSDAKYFREQISQISVEERPVTCRAKVVGGWLRDDDDQGNFGIKLSIAKPLRQADKQ